MTGGWKLIGASTETSQKNPVELYMVPTIALVLIQFVPYTFKKCNCDVISLIIKIRPMKILMPWLFADGVL